MLRDDPTMQLKKRNVPSSSTSPEDSDTPRATTTPEPASPNNPPNTHQPQQQQQQQPAAIQALHLDASPKSPGHYMAAACSRNVLLPSATAWRVLLAGPIIVWLVSTGLGMLQFSGVPSKPRDTEHLMRGFDAVFRAAGPLLPLLPLLLRWATVDAPACARAAARLARRAAPRRPPPPTAQATLPWSCLLIYTAIAAARVLFYLTHLAMQQQRRRQRQLSSSFEPLVAPDGRHVGVGFSSVSGGAAAAELSPASHVGGWVSDHVFLAASVLACLQLELVCSVSDVVKLEVEGAGMLREFCSAVSLLLCTALYACVCIDMYFTCRYFHFPEESAAGLLAGLLLFQGPVVAWLCFKARKQR